MSTHVAWNDEENDEDDDNADDSHSYRLRSADE